MKKSACVGAARGCDRRSPPLRAAPTRRRRARRARSISGAGSTFVVPARLGVDPAARVRRSGSTSPTRPSVRVRASASSHRPYGRLRRVGRTVVGRPVRGLQGLRRDPVGACRRHPIPYNLPGLNCRLRLDGTTLANIYSGQITSWNDPKIKAINPKCNLPSTKITPVYRSDNSGTTFNFTEYLSSVSSSWKQQGRVQHECQLAGRRWCTRQLRGRGHRDED